MILKFRVHAGAVATNSEGLEGFICLAWKQAFLWLGEVAVAALVENFLFVSDVENQAALPLVL